MNIWQRRLFFLAIIAIFMIITPILAFYVAGWRINRQEKSIYRVGTLEIVTKPAAAQIYIDDNQYNKTSPVDIINLSPGDYTVKITKDGYFDWIRKITISSAQVTDLSDIFLVKKIIDPKPLLGNSFSIIQYNSDYSQALGYADKILNLVNFKKGNVEKKVNFDHDLKKIVWSPNSDQAILQTTDNSFFILNISDFKIRDLSEFLNEKILELFWSNPEHDIVYAISDTGNYRINLFQNTKNLENNLDNVIFFNSQFTIQKKYDSLIFSKANTGEQNAFKIQADSKFTIFEQRDNTLPLLDTANQKLFFYDFAKNNFSEFSIKVAGLQWPANNDEILFYNNNEIWQWNLKTDERSLLTRTSDLITYATFILNTKYVLYFVSPDKMYITEISGPQKNSYELNLLDINQINYFDNNSLLFILANSLLYKIQL
ncbi:MAG: PEGA domain-containing protein [Patescibacteria group bacterium]|jgi:hypothetical protein